MIARTKGSKLLIKYILSDCRIRFYCQNYNLNQKRNKDKSLCECQKPLKQHFCKENCISNSSKCVCECEHLSTYAKHA